MIEFTDKEAAGLAEYVQLTSELIDGLQKQVSTMEEKQAGEEQPVLDKDQVQTTVENLAKAGLVKQDEMQDKVAELQDPSNVLKALNNVAALRNKAGTMRPMGKVAGDKSKSDHAKVRESDATFEKQFG